MFDEWFPVQPPAADTDADSALAVTVPGKSNTTADAMTASATAAVETLFKSFFMSKYPPYLDFWDNAVGTGSLHSEQQDPFSLLYYSILFRKLQVIFKKARCRQKTKAGSKQTPAGFDRARNSRIAFRPAFIDKKVFFGNKSEIFSDLAQDKPIQRLF